MQRGCSAHDVVDLVAARKRPAVEEDNTVGISLQELACGFKHEMQAEVILTGRVFDFVGGKKSVPDLIFIKYPAAQATSEFARKRSLSAARKAGHQNDHDPLKHARSSAMNRVEEQIHPLSSASHNSWEG